MEQQNYALQMFYMNRLQLLFSRIYFAFPIIIIPIVCYILSNWWLLFGIPTFYGGGTFPKFLIIIISLVAICLWMYIRFDIHDYPTFMFFCLLIGNYLWSIPQKYQKKEEAIKQQLTQYLNKEIEKIFPEKNI